MCVYVCMCVCMYVCDLTGVGVRTCDWCMCVCVCVHVRVCVQVLSDLTGVGVCEYISCDRAGARRGGFHGLGSRV